MKLLFGPHASDGFDGPENPYPNDRKTFPSANLSMLMPYRRTNVRGSHLGLLVSEYNVAVICYCFDSSCFLLSCICEMSILIAVVSFFNFM